MLQHLSLKGTSIGWLWFLKVTASVLASVVKTTQFYRVALVDLPLPYFIKVPSFCSTSRNYVHVSGTSPLPFTHKFWPDGNESKWPGFLVAWFCNSSL